MLGMLYIVATPIGNLKDITLRAIETLKSVDLIACEDTRRTKILLVHYGIHTPTTSYFEHNKITKGKFLINELKEGKDIALVSDAGTPGISDPGFNIIRDAIREGISVTVVPGANAAISALAISGLPTDKFTFEGFLPVKETARQKRLKILAKEEKTIIIYESPYRILKALVDIKEIMGERNIAVVRELTKKFEEIRRGTPDELLEYFSSHTPRGEFIIVIGPIV